eukprot:1387443-Rhodomonas_salina.2
MDSVRQEIQYRLRSWATCARERTVQNAQYKARVSTTGAISHVVRSWATCSRDEYRKGAVLDLRTYSRSDFGAEVQESEVEGRNCITWGPGGAAIRVDSRAGTLLRDQLLSQYSVCREKG